MRNLPNSVQMDELDRDLARTEKQKAGLCIGKCDICGEDIYTGDYYLMPDNSILCTMSPDCLEKWAKEYKNDII